MMMVVVEPMFVFACSGANAPPGSYRANVASVWPEV